MNPPHTPPRSALEDRQQAGGGGAKTSPVPQCCHHGELGTKGMLTVRACQLCSKGRYTGLRCRAAGWLPNRAVLSLWNTGSPTPTGWSFFAPTYIYAHTEGSVQRPQLLASAGTARYRQTCTPGSRPWVGLPPRSL